VVGVRSRFFGKEERRSLSALGMTSHINNSKSLPLMPEESRDGDEIANHLKDAGRRVLGGSR
jgi:hypothetical protein